MEFVRVKLVEKGWCHELQTLASEARSPTIDSIDIKKIAITFVILAAINR
jgi:hypothetical protein